MVEGSNTVLNPIDVGPLRSLLRSLRSRQPSVREWALQAASCLDAPHQTQLDAIVERSFEEEAGRRRFWRFMAYFGSSVGSLLVVSLMRHLAPGFLAGPGQLMMLVGWLALWRVTDQAAKRAFVLPEDGRKLWQQRRKAAARPLRPDGRPLLEEECLDVARDSEAEEICAAGSSDSSSEVYEPSAAVQAFVQELTDVLTPVREAAQQKVALLSVEDLLAAARLLIERYEQHLDAESRKRKRLSNLAFWLFVAGVFTDCWYLMLAVLGLGLYALYYRNEDARRHLDALPIVLEELSRRGVPVSLDRIVPPLDPTFADRMKRQCPALNRFLPDRAPSQDLAEHRDSLYLGIGYSSDIGVSIRTAIPSAETRDALRELSADVLLAPFDDVEETLVALKKLEETGDEAVIPMLQRLASQPLRFLSVRAPLRTVREYWQDAQRIREAARSCLNTLQARSDVQQRTLLRPSEATTGDALLRPVETSSSDLRPEELLRPSASEAQTPETAATMEPYIYISTQEAIEVKAQINHG